jgi:hypothetical protein
MATEPTLPAPLVSYEWQMLEGDWPILAKAEINQPILDQIKLEANGSSIINHHDYLWLGAFFIQTDLLTQHSVQREPTRQNVTNLIERFEKSGIRRVQNKGVVIGVGEGWYDMKKNVKHHIFISPTSPHCNRLNAYRNGPIGQIIRGGHRTLAIRDFSKSRKCPEQNYWMYDVYIPGMCL